MKRESLAAMLHPNAVVVTYRLPDAEPVRAVIDGSKHDQFDVCDRAQRKLFPDLTDEDRRQQRAHADAVLRKHGMNTSAVRGQGEAAGANPRLGPSERRAAGNPPVDSRETPSYQIGDREPGPHSTRDSSMAAITRLRAEGLITERQRELLEFFASRPAADNYTRQEIARQMMQRHGAKWAINQVCGRVNELIKLGRLRELPNPRRCNVTQESVNAIERGVW